MEILYKNTNGVEQFSFGSATFCNAKCLSFKETYLRVPYVDYVRARECGTVTSDDIFTCKLDPNPILVSGLVAVVNVATGARRIVRRSDLYVREQCDIAAIAPVAE